jgi:hypothetical protein
MNVRLKNCLLFVLAIFMSVFAVTVLYSATVYKTDHADYTTYGTGDLGLKALYLLTGKCGFRVSRYHYPVKFLRDNPVMVAYCPAGSVFNDNEEKNGLRNWLNNGNTLVVILDHRNIDNLWIFDYISENRRWYETENAGNVTITWYGLENGVICVLDSADRFLNKNISDNTGAAVAFINVLARINNPKVVFNEYYRFMQKPAPGLWDLIGHTGQLIVIQLVTVVLLVVIRGWKTFGRVRGDREMTKRAENEIVMALAGLYQKEKAYSLVLSNYYGRFVRRYGGYLRTAGYVRDKALPLLNECEYYLRTGDLSKKKLKEIVLGLQKLELEISNRNQRQRKE